jgi:hypothetical protein
LKVVPTTCCFVQKTVKLVQRERMAVQRKSKAVQFELAVAPWSMHLVQLEVSAVQQAS